MLYVLKVYEQLALHCDTLFGDWILLVDQIQLKVRLLHVLRNSGHASCPHPAVFTHNVLSRVPEGAKTQTEGPA